MKKGIVFILAFLYLTSSCEATVYLHYCMGKAVSFSFIPDQSDHCQKCGMKKSNTGKGCCKDEQKLIKSDKHQKLTDGNVSTFQVKKWVDPVYSYPDYCPVVFNSVIITHAPAHGPPDTSPVPAYLMNRALLV